MNKERLKKLGIKICRGIAPHALVNTYDSIKIDKEITAPPDNIPGNVSTPPRQFGNR